MDMRFDIDQLDDAGLLNLANALLFVLDARTHKHNHLGQEIIVKGSLSKALKLPDIISQLASTTKKRESARDRFVDIWYTLSSLTCDRAMEKAGIYQPKDLDWDDPRSNRHPNVIGSRLKY